MTERGKFVDGRLILQTTESPIMQGNAQKISFLLGLDRLGINASISVHKHTSGFQLNYNGKFASVDRISNAKRIAELKFGFKEVRLFLESDYKNEKKCQHIRRSEDQLLMKSRLLLKEV
jgi:hypothetical protein